MCKTTRAFQQKIAWALIGVMILVATAGMVSPYHRAWASPLPPPPTPEQLSPADLEKAKTLDCDLGISADLVIVLMRPSPDQRLVVLANKSARSDGGATVVAGGFFNDQQEATEALATYLALCRTAMVGPPPAPIRAVQGRIGPTGTQPDDPFSFEAGHGVADVTAADFNHDGLSDLVFANDGSNMVSIVLGTANLTFGPATAFPVGDGPKAVATGDLNQDGNVDVVTANAEFPNTDLTVMFGNGDGTLQAPISLAGEETPIDVAVGDLNGDTLADIVFTRQPAGLSLIISNGNGTFQEPASLDDNLSPISVQIVDMNGDEVVDLLSSSAIHLGHGNGTFQAPIPFPTDLFHFYATAGHLNDDEVLDVAAVSANTNVVTAM